MTDAIAVIARIIDDNDIEQISFFEYEEAPLLQAIVPASR